jgi:hypothetical protein
MITAILDAVVFVLAFPTFLSRHGRWFGQIRFPTATPSP